MLFSNLNIRTKSLRIFSLIITLAGIAFILAANHVGNIAIRMSMIIVFFASLLNLRISYPFSTKIEKAYMVLGMAGSVLVFIMPQLTMLIVGIGLLGISVPIVIKAVKDKDFADKIMLLMSIAGILFSVYCIINSRAALNTVIRLMGVGMVILGCIALFASFDISRRTQQFEKDMAEELDEFRFENAEDITNDDK